MAVPANAQRFRMAPLKVGVMLGVSPSSDPTFDMEIARATSSGVYATITRLTGKGLGVPVVYTDLLPQDNFTRSYKARAVKDGWLEGDYTAVVSAKPIELPEIVPNVTPLTGRAIGAALYVSTGKPVQYGQPSAKSAYAKEMKIYPFQFWSTNNTVGTRQDDQYLHPTNTATLYGFRAQVPLPANAVLGSIDWFGQRPTGGTLRFRIRQRVNATIINDIVDYTCTGVGTITKTTTGYTASATSNAIAFPNYFMQVDIQTTAGSTAGTWFGFAEVNYFTPSVAVS